MLFERRLPRVLLVLPCAALLSGCATQRSWRFVQDVGGLMVGAPVRTAAGVELPVQVDVSGLRAVTTPPRAIHSSLAARIDAARAGSRIELALYTAPPGGAQRRCLVERVALGKIPAGRYEVVFAEPGGARVQLGTVVIP